MALSLSAALTFTATQVVLTNDTGDYSIDNTGGYGAPNTPFASLAHYAIIRKKNVNGVADEVLAINSYDPLTVEEFTFTREIDGYYEGTLIDINIWTAGTYAAGKVVYYNGSIYVANTSTTETPGTGDEWDITSDLTEIEDSDDVYTAIDGRTTPYNADVYWSKQIAQNSQRGRCGICEDDRQKERLDKIEFHISCVLVADQQGNNQDGEWNVLSLIELGAE